MDLSQIRMFKKTVMVVISPDCKITPKELFHYTVMLGLPVTVKETCYGVLIEGKEGIVDEALTKILEYYDSYSLFVKERGFPIGDLRVCRFKLKSGPRPGFHQLNGEYRLLPLISKALKEKRRLDRMPKRWRKKKLKACELKKVIEKSKS